MTGYWSAEFAPVHLIVSRTVNAQDLHQFLIDLEHVAHNKLRVTLELKDFIRRSESEVQLRTRARCEFIPVV